MMRDEMAKELAHEIWTAVSENKVENENDIYTLLKAGTMTEKQRAGCEAKINLYEEKIAALRAGKKYTPPQKTISEDSGEVKKRGRPKKK